MDPVPQLRASLMAQSLPPPSASFLASLVAARSPPPPLPSLVATAKARLLACDLTASDLVDSSLLAALPPFIHSPSVPEASLPADVHLQLVDLENLSLSRWDQVQELEAVERGERTIGRRIVNISANDDNDGQDEHQEATIPATLAATYAATHRLVLQDHQGNRAYALELQPIARLGLGKSFIGDKFLLRAGTRIARGTILLTPENCLLLGGKIDSWHEAWLQARIVRLKHLARRPVPATEPH